MIARAGEEEVVADRELLRRIELLLGTLAALLCAVIAWQARASWARWPVMAEALLCAGIAALMLRARLSLLALRAIEVVLFGSCIVAIAIHGLDHAHNGDEWLRTILYLSLVLMCYGVLVPNSARRAAWVTSGLAAASVTAAVATRLREAGDLELGASGPIAFLVFAAVVSITAAAVIALFRTLAIQTRIANMYDLVHLLGRGGMGDVWRAQHQRLARPVAIKIIRADVLAERPEHAAVLRDALEHEARTTAHLRSPNTIEVYDFGTAADGTFYLVMEFLEGIDLESMVRRFGPVEPARLLSLLEQMCMSLAEAHATGLVHGDIKPANIFISRLGMTHDHVKVLDFGLSRPRSKSASNGVLVGTPAYLSPEAILGEHEIDARADIYAIGCVAYFASTGQLVFDEDDLVGLAAAHVGSEPARPSLRTEAAIPEKLEAIIMRCLEKAPAKRFANARALASTLCQLRSELYWTPFDAERWWLSHRPVPSGPTDTMSDAIPQSDAGDS